MKLLRWVLCLALFSAATVLFVLPRFDVRAPGYAILTCWAVVTVVAIMFASGRPGVRGSTSGHR